MKLKKALLIILSLITLIMEILPYGAVLNFANPEGEPLRKTYSYFNLIPYGYANFGPFISGLLTCILLVLAVVCLFKQSKKLNTVVKSVAGIAAAASLMPLLLGFNYVSAIGVLITVLLAAAFGCSFIINRSEL